MVGAAPVCPPERPRSGVSIRKRHVPIHKSSISIRKRHIHIRKGGISIHKRCMLTPRHVCAFADGCALAGRRGRAHRHRPYQPPSNPSTTQPSSFLSVGRASSGNHFLFLSIGGASSGNLFLFLSVSRASSDNHFSCLSIGGASSGNLFSILSIGGASSGNLFLF